MKVKLILLLFTGLLCCNLSAQKNIVLTSPDGNIRFNLTISKNLPEYSVTFMTEKLVEHSTLNLVFDDGKPFENYIQLRPPIVISGRDNYKLIVGKTSAVMQRFNQATFFLTGVKQSRYRINIEVKVFDDGVAFRYVFPIQNGKTSYALLSEQTQFNVAGNPIVKALQLSNFTTSHEGLYSTIPYKKIKADTLLDIPALFQFPNNTFMAVTEAALLDYAGMYLVKRNGILTSQLSPLPTPSGDGGRKGSIKVKATLPHASPWRVLLIGNKIGTLIESNMLTSLCPPLALKETSWIQTGTTTFPWWNGTVIPDTVKGGNNFETNKYYIDFCAANNVRYHTVVEYGGHEWYSNDGEGYQPGKNFDVTKPVDGLDMKQVCDYAHSKGVGVRVWVHWKALYPKLDTAFALFEKWGLAGMMVDFMDRDDQEMVNIQTEILQKAAAHHLHIQFHGAYKPTGLHRTYPNEFTREGTLNYETYKWDTTLTVDDDLNIVVTRMLAGSTDYHLGGFHAFGMPHTAGRGAFKVQSTRPFVMGTRCHMLGMYVVLENYQGMLCDYPDAYIGQPGFEVLQHMPVTWDETKVLEAEVGKYIAIARRNKNSWYIGTITDSIARKISINLNFLPAGKYVATMYSDAADANENANHLTQQNIMVDKNKIIPLSLAAGGGNIVILKKLKK